MALGRRWSREDRSLVMVGGVALAIAAFVSCGDGNDGDGAPSPDASAGDDGSSGTGVSSGDCAADPGTSDNTAAVVAAANALVAALTTEQQTAIRYDKTLANAAQWSNFPTTFVARNGVRIGDMSTEAQRAAVALAEVAAGATGATLLEELREADEWLVTDGKASSTDYGRGLYYFSIHGTPSTSAAWMLQIAGHHLAYNFMYNGKCTSATPLFDGAEPMDWTDTSGVAHSPMNAQRAAMQALVGSISAIADSKLSGTYSDLVNGPGGGGGGPGGGGGGGGDTKYPSSLSYPVGTTGRGVAVASLTDEQKSLVKAAMETWVKNVADPVSGALLALYESDEALAETYVAWTGSSDLSTQASYVRIDGPRVWIEASVQGGVIYRDEVHWHTVYRDKVADYGAEFIE